MCGGELRIVKKSGFVYCTEQDCSYYEVVVGW
jgi:hypothetical protein